MSLRTGPNREFAARSGFPLIKRMLFAAAGARYDRAARKQGKEYRFIFVRADGAQLGKITDIVEQYHIMPRVDPHEFGIEQANAALELVARGAYGWQSCRQVLTCASCREWMHMSLALSRQTPRSSWWRGGIRMARL